MFFEPLDEIINLYLDDWFTPIMDAAINYLLYEDPSQIINMESIEIGFNDKQTEYFNNYLYDDFYGIISRFSIFATTKERNIDALFENQESIKNFVDYLNKLDLDYLIAHEGYYEGNTTVYKKKYYYIQNKIYANGTTEPETQYGLLLRYMNKNIYTILTSYAEKAFEKLRNPIK